MTRLTALLALALLFAPTSALADDTEKRPGPTPGRSGLAIAMGGLGVAIGIVSIAIAEPDERVPAGVIGGGSIALGTAGIVGGSVTLARW